jgi:hypothetical protein
MDTVACPDAQFSRGMWDKVTGNSSVIRNERAEVCHGNKFVANNRQHFDMVSR